MKKQTSKHEMMTPINKRWKEFCYALERELRLSVKCDHTHRDCYRAMASLNIEPCCQLMSIGYFYANGGFCSCEVLMNVGAERRGKPKRIKQPVKKASKKR